MGVRRGPRALMIITLLSALAGAAGARPHPAAPPQGGLAVSWAFQTCGAARDPACPQGQVCQAGTPPAIPGFCRPAAPNCPQTGPGVCAEDANTWPNHCLTEAAGIRVMHDGPCQRARPLPR